MTARHLDTDSVAVSAGWRSMDTRPKNDGHAFLVLLPPNGLCDSLVLQVSNFGGAMYADCCDCLVDWADRITDAVGWMPLAGIEQHAMRYVPLTGRMAQDIAAMAKARPLAKLILAVPAEQTAEPQPISVYADTDLDPEPIGVVVP